MEQAVDPGFEGCVELASLWEQLLSGQLSVVGSYCSSGRCHAELRRECRRAVPTVPRRLLERFFLGQSQKSLALEHALSHATVAAHCSAALHAFAPGTRAAHAPVLIVMAAHAARGASLAPAVVEEGGSDGRLLAQVPIPGVTFKDRLTAAEQAVAELTIQGAFHEAMARARGTSRRTIANQLASIYFKVGVSARNELRAKAIVEMSGAARDAPGPTGDCTLAPAFDQGDGLRVA